MKNLYRFLSMIAIAAVLCVYSSACSIVKTTDEKYFTFTLDEASQTYVVSASAEVMPQTVIIPAEYEGKPVSAIAENGFNGENCYAIKDVVIKGEGEVIIGENAFSDLKNLRSLELRTKESVQVGKFAFQNCPALNELDISTEIKAIDIQAFAFKAAGLETVSLQAAEGISIGAYAFANCKSLKELSLVNLTLIDVTSVEGCALLESISATGGYTSADGHLFDAEGETLIKFAPAGADGYVVNCKNVGPSAFSDSVNLKTVTLSESVVSVGAYAFNQSSVKEIICKADYSAFDAEWLFGTSASIK